MGNKYTKQLLEPIVKSSTTWREVCLKLGVQPLSGAQGHITKRAKELGVDYSHFPGIAWSKGKKLSPKRPIEYYLTENSTAKSHALKLRLWAEGLKEKKCEKCDLEEWYGKEAPLELDHINSNHFDNRIENLQILCANCHAVKDK